jgi:hypothetical protein
MVILASGRRARCRPVWCRVLASYCGGALAWHNNEKNQEITPRGHQQLESRKIPEITRKRHHQLPGRQGSPDVARARVGRDQARPEDLLEHQRVPERGGLARRGRKGHGGGMRESHCKQRPVVSPVHSSHTLPGGWTEGRGGCERSQPFTHTDPVPLPPQPPRPIAETHLVQAGDPEIIEGQGVGAPGQQHTHHIGVPCSHING